MGSSFSALGSREIAEGDEQAASPNTHNTQTLMKYTAYCWAGWAVYAMISRKFWSRYEFFQALAPIKKQRWDQYTLSITHATAVSAFAIYKLFVRPGVDVNTYLKSATFILSYFINDFIMARDDWRAKPADVFHHMAGIALCLSVMLKKRLLGLIPHIQIVEVSTIFLGLMWALREVGRENTAAFRGVAYSFVLLYFLLRILWFPYVVYNVWTKQYEDLKKLGAGRYGFLLALYLQFHWFVQIIRSVVLHAKKK